MANNHASQGDMPLNMTQGGPDIDTIIQVCRDYPLNFIKSFLVNKYFLNAASDWLAAAVYVTNLLLANNDFNRDFCG